CELRAEQMKAVLLSAMRTHAVVVVDLSRSLGSAGGEALRRADLAVLVVREDVRGVAAGCEVARQIAGDSSSDKAGPACSSHVWSPAASIGRCSGRSPMTRLCCWRRSEAIRRPGPHAVPSLDCA